MRLPKPLIAGIALSILAIGPALAQQGKGAKGGQGAKGGAGAKEPAAASASAAAPKAPASSAPAAAASATATVPPASSATSASSAAPPSAPAPTATAATPPAATVDGQTYSVRLRDLEQRVDELKEQIRRSHTRLSLLSDTVLSGGAQGSRAEIVFQNDMSSAFRLTRALFVLDGGVQANKADESGALSEQATIPIVSGSIPPGDHTLQVLLQFQGNGYGVFSYLKGYKFEVRSTHSFKAPEGKTMNLQVIAYEKGGVTTPLEERPAVRYTEKLSTGISAGASAPAAATPPAAGVSVGVGGK